MNETGTVKERRGNLLVVEVERGAHCSGCKACAPSGSGKNIIEVEDDGSAALPGDKVTLSLPQGDILKASLLFYLMPLVFLCLGILLCRVFGGKSQGLAAVSGMFGLAFGFLVLKVIEAGLKSNGFMKIKVRK